MIDVLAGCFIVIGLIAPWEIGIAIIDGALALMWGV